MEPQSPSTRDTKTGVAYHFILGMALFFLSLVTAWTPMTLAKPIQNKKPVTTEGFSAKAKNKRVQEVNFEEMALQGQIRNPYGSYLVQKNGLKFVPLYEVQKDMDEKIRSASEWMR
ncbi:MAG: hypothetical protein N2Z70_07270 [Bdellovibrionaceae bacterium]|jgi:hypothetical protein|nr:hypothetical protein [Pseudobdellovibrionaceae bacterium]